MLPPTQARFSSEIVSEPVFLIKVLNLWLLTLISLVDVNSYFNLLSVFFFSFYSQIKTSNTAASE